MTEYSFLKMSFMKGYRPTKNNLTVNKKGKLQIKSSYSLRNKKPQLVESNVKDQSIDLQVSLKCLRVPSSNQKTNKEEIR